MIDEEKVEVTENQEVEQVEEQPEVQEHPVQPKETAQAKNFRELRERTERAERERDEYYRKVRDLEARTNNNPAPVEDDDEEFAIAPDELVEGKHLAKLARENKQIKRELKEFRQQASQMTDETRLKIEFPDLEKVVTTENLKLLEEMEPEVANMIKNSTGSLYERGKGAYKMLKKYGVDTRETYEAEKEIIKKNTSKPKPLASVSPQKGDNPLAMANAFANGLTPELEKQLLAEMEEACSRY